MIQLKTERLVLREPVIKDAEQISLYNIEEEFWQYTTIPVVPPSLEGTRDFLQSCIDENAQEPRSLYYFVLVDKELDQVIGDMRFKIEHHDAGIAEFGYGLNPAMHGKGYMTEALREILRFGFEDMQMNRIHAVTYPENIGSIKVMEKCGMTHEGTLRQNEYVRGRLFDEMYFAILKDEYTQ